MVTTPPASDDSHDNRVTEADIRRALSAFADAMRTSKLATRLRRKTGPTDHGADLPADNVS